MAPDTAHSPDISAPPRSTPRTAPSFRVTSRTLEDLDWARVLDAIAGHCATEPARLAAAGLPFLPDLDTVRLELTRVAELMAQLATDGPLPLAGLESLEPALVAVARGVVLDSDALLAIARTAHAIDAVRRHLRVRVDPAPEVAALAEDLPEVGLLADELASTFDANGEVRDDASPELRDARRRLAKLHQNTKARLDRFLGREDVQEMLQDSYYTLRGDRYVVPVISSSQSLMPGIIHGASNTAQTVYVEPQEFVEVNNRIKVAEAEVRAAIRQVLTERTGWVADEADALRHGCARLVALDLLQARARLALELDAAVPRVAPAGDDAPLHLLEARNPHLLLQGDPVVPNTILLDAERSFIVVTGPNTGGKTVTLKTAGTLTLMVRVGMPIPAEADSQMVLFDGLDTLIGDAQDLSARLSTFSGHLVQVRELVEGAQAGALLLLDEIIVGTEPERAAALAIAVLEALADRGARGFVTTHYERVKALALGDGRFANANVGTDPRTGQPNYRLQLGEPGSSSPFEVALSLGLDEAIVQRARDIAHGGEGLAKAFEQLEATRQEASRAAAEASLAKAATEREAEKLRQMQAELQTKADAWVRRVREQTIAEAEQALEALRARVALVQKANDPNALRRLRDEVAADKEAASSALRDEPHGSDTGARGGPPRPPRPGGGGGHRYRASRGTHSAAPEPYGDGGDVAPQALTEGQRVWLRTLGKPVEIRERLRGGEQLRVAIGGVALVVDAKDVGALAGGPVEPKRSSTRRGVSPPPRPGHPPKPKRVGVGLDNLPPGGIDGVDDDDPISPTPRSAQNSVDVRGLRRDDIAGEVEPLLDRAYAEDRRVVWIIHGHGTGALRDEVRQTIKGSPYVSHWRPGRRHEGGDGVTLAWLRVD